MIAIAIVDRRPRRLRRSSRTRSASGSCTTCARPSTGTSSASRSPSSRARGRARCSRGSRTTSAASRTSSRRPPPRSSRTSTTVLATVVAMFVLDWRLALFSLGLLPLFVLLTRRVGKRAQADHDDPTGDDGRHVDARAGVALGLGDPARQDDGAVARARPTASRTNRARLADLEVRQRMAGRWVMASIQMSFAIMPALVYWFAGQTLDRRRRSRSAPSSLSRRCRRGCSGRSGRS